MDETLDSVAGDLRQKTCHRARHLFPYPLEYPPGVFVERYEKSDDDDGEGDCSHV